MLYLLSLLPGGILPKDLDKVWKLYMDAKPKKVPAVANRRQSKIMSQANLIVSQLIPGLQANPER